MEDVFEDIADLTINLNKVLLAHWLHNGLRVKYRNGYGIQIEGVAAHELWQILSRRYTPLSPQTIINTHAIVIIKWSNDHQQAEVKLDNATVEFFYGYEAQELRRVLRAIQNEGKQTK